MKLYEFTITGKAESQLSGAEDLELTMRNGKRVQLFHTIRENLEKLSPGDDLEVVLKIFAPARPAEAELA